MKIKVMLKEGTWDSFKTPQYQSITLTPQQLAQPKTQELIAAKYGMKVVGDISVGETVFSDVYRVEPDDAASYPTKTLVMKLSANDAEYQPYEKIKNIRNRMIDSTDEGDNRAAKFLPIVYLAESIQISSENPKYKSIIIMEPLVSFTGNLKDMPRMLTADPSRTPPLLVSMLKDEEFLNRVIAAGPYSQEEATKIENMIFTGVTPNMAKMSQDEIDTIVKSTFSNGFMIRKIPEKPIEAFKSRNKLTPEEEKKIIAWQVAYDKEAQEFLENMNLIRKEFRRIGYIFVDVLGPDVGPEQFMKMIERIRKSTPVAPMSGANPHPQNLKTRPEEVTPGAASFNDALVRLEQYGLSRKDLHGKNYMMREDGQIVISDPGLFQTIDAIKESKNANYKVKTKRNY